MKKIMLGAVAALAGTALFAQSYSLVNTFGGNSDCMSGDDFLSFERKAKTVNDDGITPELDSDGKQKYNDYYSNDEDVNISNRLDFNFASEKLDGRIRVEFDGNKANGKNIDTRLRGYGRFRPVEQFGILAGNSFFTRFGVEGSYLAAADDNPSEGLMLKNGLGVFAELGDDVSIRLGGAIDADAKYDSLDNFYNHAGVDVGINDTFSIGAVLKDAQSDFRSVGAFFAFKGVENLILNAGYVYNYTSDDFVPLGRFEGIKHVAQASIGYTSDNFFVAADVVTSLGSDMIIEDTDGDWDSVTAKNSDDDDVVPFGTRLVANVGVTDNLTVGMDVNVHTWLNAKHSSDVIVYPNLTYALPNKFGEISTGLRLTFADQDENNDGLTAFSIPLSWKCKLLNK